MSHNYVETRFLDFEGDASQEEFYKTTYHIPQGVKVIAHRTDQLTYYANMVERTLYEPAETEGELSAVQFMLPYTAGEPRTYLFVRGGYGFDVFFVRYAAHALDLPPYTDFRTYLILSGTPDGEINLPPAEYTLKDYPLRNVPLSTIVPFLRDGEIIDAKSNEVDRIYDIVLSDIWQPCLRVIAHKNEENRKKQELDVLFLPEGNIYPNIPSDLNEVQLLSLTPSERGWISKELPEFPSKATSDVF